MTNIQIKMIEAKRDAAEQKMKGAAIACSETSNTRAYEANLDRYCEARRIWQELDALVAEIAEYKQAASIAAQEANWKGEDGPAAYAAVMIEAQKVVAEYEKR